MEELEKNSDFEKEEIFSRAVRAGKRTYFFDVKATKRDDYYITITERKRRYDQNGNFQIEKHKIFIYREDFDKFSEGLAEVIDFVQKEKGEVINFKNDEGKQNFSKVDFEDLDS